MYYGGVLINNKHVKKLHAIFDLVIISTVIITISCAGGLVAICSVWWRLAIDCVISRVQPNSAN